MKEKITEADVVNHYFPLVVNECKNSYKGLEIEDRITEGVVALIHAIRTYNTHFGCFEDYFLAQLKIIMKQKNKEAWAIRRMESIFSVDAPVRIHNESHTHLEFIRSIPYDDTIIDVEIFLARLSSLERKVIYLLINGDDLKKISDELSLSSEQAGFIMEQLQSRAKHYLDVDLT
ncbi:RNA polymerase subunit sigma-70 [Paenibacillus spiritus]|uniref:RNA polymerase subunit sigma-70 n=1 Tax=Paenibacillus spiritus TaxID=2496557 RepID=A0A5J5G557_9BACL|nr:MULTISPECIES: RNA polymerase subunit sigma-70 [Paenibacillus]KAA9002388.1 RNA polymerase subunit sigma-70 [Paenibacillus spiritus]